MKTYRRHQLSGFNATEMSSWSTPLKSTSIYSFSIIGEVARKVATEATALEKLKAFFDCQLVTLEKTPGNNRTSISEFIR